MSIEKRAFPSRNIWNGNENGTTVSSTSIHPRFVREVLDTNAGNRWLDLGSGTGVKTHPLSDKGFSLVHADINHAELNHGRESQPNGLYVAAQGEAIPFEDNKFDGAVLLALLGGVEKPLRTKIAAEVGRIIKPGGYIYVAEFARISNPNIFTSDPNVSFVDLYREQEEVTGEPYTIECFPPDAPPFFGHHFTTLELRDLFVQFGFNRFHYEQVEIVSQVSGELRPSINMWAQKLSQ